MRDGWVIVALALVVGGCAPRPKPAPVPEIVAVKVAAVDMARYRAMALGCGAVTTRTQTIGDATLLIVGRESSIATRDCFFDKAGADYRAQHPVRAWIERIIG
jgi:hypothetical protein